VHRSIIIKKSAVFLHVLFTLYLSKKAHQNGDFAIRLQHHYILKICKQCHITYNCIIYNTIEHSDSYINIIFDTGVLDGAALVDDGTDGTELDVSEGEVDGN
jgi:hypothetical protein